MVDINVSDPNPCNRICRKCQTTQVDDEIHFLMLCNNSNSIENLSGVEKYITNFITQCDIEQFISIMSGENNTIIKALAKYTYVCFKKIVVSQPPYSRTWPGASASHNFS